MTENDLLYGSSFFIQSVLERAADRFANQAFEKGLELIVDVGPQANLEVRGSENSLQRILEHLLSNAIQYTDRGEIILSAGVADASRANATIRFDVQDSGAGVFQEPQLAVLNADFPQCASLNLPEKGGLVQAQELIACLGGKLSVRCDQGAGSTFSFSIPFDKVVRKAAEDEDACGPWSDNLRVLLVDDHEVTRRLLCAKLREAKIQVVSAGNFEELVQRLGDATGDDKPFSMVIADSGLQTADGKRVDRALCDLFGDRNLPVLLLNAAATEREETDCTAQIAKPVKQTELWQAIRACVS